MAQLKFQPPRVRNIAIASIVFLFLLAVFFSLSGVIKHTGNILLFLPSQFGLVRQVSPAEIQSVDLRAPSPYFIEMNQPGPYAVFSGDASILIDDAYSEENDGAWLRVKSQATGENVKVARVERGIRPYDSPLAEGRPVFAFEISTPGAYELSYPPITWEASMTILPDYTTGKESLIWLVMEIQIVILLGIVGAALYPRYRRQQAQIESIQAPQKQRQIQGQAFWEAEKQKLKKQK
ncbi:MAG: hypothetical protein GYA48_11095 [Chloroflexi bacterium]|nr:hypothetical protein [Chloroflexota bacterium]